MLAFETSKLNKVEKKLLVTALRYIERTYNCPHPDEWDINDLCIRIDYNDPLDEDMVKACVSAMKQAVNVFDPCDAGVQFYQELLDKLEKKISNNK